MKNNPVFRKIADKKKTNIEEELYIEMLHSFELQNCLNLRARRTTALVLLAERFVAVP